MRPAPRSSPGIPVRSVNVERLLQINLALLASLGTLLLGMGQDNYFLPLLGTTAAATAVYFTDIRRVFFLNRSLASVFAVLAVLITIRDFAGTASEKHLLSIANLMIYLQIVLLFQEKNHRVYGHLAMLSLLEVVVAAALNLGFEFGILLVVFMFLALSALCLLAIHGEMSRFAAKAEESAAEPGESASPRRHENTRGPRRGGAASLRPAFTPFVPGGGLEELPAAPFARRVGMLGLTTLALSILIFFTMPRLGESSWRPPAGQGTAMVGFSGEVALDELGKILQSDQVVMRVSFYDGARNPVALLGEPYFRGNVLTEYFSNHGRGRWKKGNFGGRRSLLPEARGADTLLRMEVVQERLDSLYIEETRDFVLFHAPPAHRSDDTPDRVRYEGRRHEVVWDLGNDSRRGGPLRYALLTTGFHEGRQRAMIPHDGPPLASGELLQFDPAKHARLKDLAQQIIDGMNPTTANPLERARALERYFYTPGLYLYSLDFENLPRTPGVDPIEDFAVNHRTGHCEYFASALTLMLRSQGIPARMVVGFRGGEYNSVGNYYHVREFHAHAWVEAYIRPEHVPPGALDSSSDATGGAWLRLDGTPGAGEEAEAVAQADLASRVREIIDYLQILWGDYVLGLSAERQRKEIYEPVARTFADLAFAITDSRAWQARLRRAAIAVGLVAEGEQGEEILWWRLVAAAALAAVALAIVGRAAWPWGRRAAAWLAAKRWSRGRSSGTPVEFYARLETLLAEFGLVRRPGQTQHEFALSAGGRLADFPAGQQVAALPRKIVESFYRVRFGRLPLDSGEAEAIEHALASLQSALSAGGKRD
jgi:hypothetical protein